jgi:hypothetical protein
MAGTSRRIPRAIIAMLLAVLAGCATAPPKVALLEEALPKTVAEAPASESSSTKQIAEQPVQRPTDITAEALGIYRLPEVARQAPSDLELQVIDSAKLLLGKPPNARVVVNGREFILDCIGTVSAIYYRMDIDVTKDFAKYSGNGVNRFYMSLKDQGVLHTDKYPRPGDAIIWDNTWDANGDGDRTNDPRTHAGIVLAVDDDGTIHYVHENLSKGVVIELMNLLQPDARTDAAGKTLNSSLAIATKTGGPRPEHFLAGDVFDAFGDVLGADDYFAVAVSSGEASVRVEPTSGEPAIAMAVQE